MKKNLLKNIIITLLLVLLPTSIIYSAELGSTNFKIVGATTKGGGTLDTISGNYSALVTVGEIGNSPRNYSTSYKMFTSPEAAFIANVPQVSCFETTTDGSSSCTTGPAALTTGGMVAICGAGGCYNKARFEISTNENPTDTLYSIQISEDNFSSDLRYIDGATYRPEGESTHSLADYKTKTNWETETFNIQGLDASTQYYIRVTALHGTFTESELSPVASTTTGAGAIYFDIDIASSTGYTADSNSPYNISFTGGNELIGGSAAITATNRIWLDATTNSEGGFAIVVMGKNGGLKSATTTQTITSATANLDSVLSGFGLQSEYIDYDDSNSLLGAITATTDYSGTINSVGAIATTANKIYDADGPIVAGRMSLKVIAKPGTDKTPATDYQEEIIFVFIPRY
jgi:hypothetical protein